MREVTYFVSKAVAMLRAISLAPLHYSALQMLLNSVLPLNYVHTGECEQDDCNLQGRFL